ncbi:MAG: hypothetical protein DRI61_13600, partial [Chloroflexi bacterium]
VYADRFEQMMNPKIAQEDRAMKMLEDLKKSPGFAPSILSPSEIDIINEAYDIDLPTSEDADVLFQEDIKKKEPSLKQMLRKESFLSQKELQAAHKELVKFINQNLPEGSRELAYRRAAQARTPGEIGKVVQAVVISKNRFRIDKILSRVKGIKSAARAAAKQSDAAHSEQIAAVFPALRPRSRVRDIKMAISRLARSIGAERRGATSEYHIGRLDVEHEMLSQLAADLDTVDGGSSVRSLLPSEVADVVNTIQSVVHLELHKNDMLAAEETRKADKVIEQTVNELRRKRNIVDLKRVGYRRGQQDLVNLWRHVGSYIGNIMGRYYRSDSTAYKYVVEDQAKANDSVLRLRRDATKFIAEKAGGKKGTREALKNEVEVSIGGENYTFRGGDIAGLAATLLDPDARQKLDGATVVMGGRPILISANDYRAVWDATPEKLQKLAQGFFEWRNGRQAEEVDKTALKIFGRKTSKKNAMPLFPDQAERPREYNRVMGQHAMREESRPRWKHRLKEGSPSYIIPDLAIMIDHDVNSAAVFAYKVPVARDAMRILDGNRKELRLRTRDTGDNVYNALKERVAQWEELRPTKTAFSKLVGKSVRAFYVQALGLPSLHIGTQQMASWVTVKAHIPWKHRKTGIILGAPAAWKASQRYAANSIFAADRFNHHDAMAVSDPSAGQGHHLSLTLPSKREAVGSAFTAQIPFFDRVTLGRIYAAVESMKKSEGFKGKELAREAAATTDQIVRDTPQPTWDAAHMTGLQLQAAADPVYKPFTWFSTVPLNVINYVERSYQDARDGIITKKQATRQIVGATVEQTVALVLLRKATFATLGVAGTVLMYFNPWRDDEDERDLKERIADRIQHEINIDDIGWESVERAVSIAPVVGRFVGTGVGMGRKMAQGETASRAFAKSSTAGSVIVDPAMDAAANLVNAMNATTEK